MRDDASQRQVDAARPGWSTWLAANAGSGKTRVLTDRVARLLLSGVDPARILCLTYTKAAASEMQNRLFARLGEWAMMPEAKLRPALEALGIEGGIEGTTLAEARRLFARAIETPGGLRIQTIHSFCATLLRRFPLEAGVSPQFTELDDRAAKLLREEIVEEMADSAYSETISTLAALFTGEDFGQLAGEVAREGQRLVKPLGRAALAKLFDLPPTLDESNLLTSVFLGDESLWLPQVIATLMKGKDTDAKAALKLAQIDLTAPNVTLLPELEGIFLYGADAKAPFTAKTDRFPTKDTRLALGDLGDKLADLMRRVETARPHRLGLRAVARNLALHRFAAAFLPIYAERKTLRGALDFDDLIARAKALLTDPTVAQWVLFRLDGGIDHILVDEAQDTSPDQWRVIELLAQEFTAGEGARNVERTIFVVGDQKQSIYSFQGADVSAFARMRETFRDRLDTVGAPFQTLELEHSFRSSPAILNLVDATFPDSLHPALGGASHHIAFRDNLPGRVEIWPPIAPSSNPEDEDWSDPVDLIAGEHHTAELGRRVADRIRQILAAGTMIPTAEGPRKATAGDFLVLVRRRSPLFSEVIRACKAAGLPIAGADRLHLGGEMAVKDIKALLAFLTLPEDDLALAELLRSPLFGMSEAELYAVAQPRKGYLWEALRNIPEHAEIVSVLADLRNNADFLRPFDLIERALTRHDGRRKFLARLGAEAEDGIDALLAQALAYERNEIPSLTGFLTWLQTDDVQIKRQMEGAGGKIRVMTVHGAKGLEAPIVILPDTADLTPQDRNELYTLGDTAVWRMPTGESPAAIDAVRRERAARAQAESMRLLYVALTRAQSWLIVAAAGNLASQRDSKAARDSAWYDLIRAGAERIGAASGAGGTLVFAHGESPTATDTTPASAQKAETETALPDWARRVAPAATVTAKMLKPSALGGAKALFGETESEADQQAAMARGSDLHILLEHLPESPETDWPKMAEVLVPHMPGLLEEARRVILAPYLAEVFAPHALKEVSVTAEIDGQRMLGAIDRLIITSERILAVDFKSNQIVPSTPEETPEGLLRQMRAYAQALRQIYPGRSVETALLWTKTAELMLVT